jgi:hypothetical protein
MNLEALISLLFQSNWAFLAGWILLLVAALAASFSDKPLSPAFKSWRSDDTQIRR